MPFGLAIKLSLLVQFSRILLKTAGSSWFTATSATCTSDFGAVSQFCAFARSLIDDAVRPGDQVVASGAVLSHPSQDRWFFLVHCNKRDVHIGFRSCVTILCICSISN